MISALRIVKILSVFVRVSENHSDAVLMTPRRRFTVARRQTFVWILMLLLNSFGVYTLHGGFELGGIGLRFSRCLSCVWMLFRDRGIRVYVFLSPHFFDYGRHFLLL